MESNINTAAVQNATAQVRPFSTEWFVSFKSPLQLWEDNWFALVFEVASAVVLLQVFRHAKKSGPSQTYLLLAAMSATISFEILPVIPREGYQLWWYHQGIVNVLKQRLPSYIICFYTLVHYLGHSLTSRSNLPPFTRSVVTAFSSTLLAFPCLYLAPHLLLLFFHFDDPLFDHNLLGVPYIQLLILTLLFFHTSHLFNQNYEEIQPQDQNTFNYVKCSLQTGAVSAIYTIVEQYILYIALNLTMRLNTSVCLLFVIAVLVWLAKDELKAMHMTSYSIEVSGFLAPLKRKEWWAILATFLLVSTVPLWLKTQNLKSTSDRLELGPCYSTHSVMNTSPLFVDRRRFVCPDDTFRLNFDFHCVSQNEVSFGVQKKASHYTICGKPIQKPAQMAKQVAAYSFFCLAVFHVVMMLSFNFKQVKKISEDCKKAE